MEKKIEVVKFEDVKPAVLHGEDIESRRLVTKWRENSGRMSLSVATVGKRFTGKTTYDKEDEILYLLEGNGKILWKGGEAEMKKGMAVFIPVGTEYQIQARETITLVAILSPPIE